MITQAQGQAVVDTLRKDTAAALARAQQVQSDSESGVIHGALALVGATADNAVDAAVGDFRMQLGAIDSLERTLPAAVADDSKADGWVALAHNLQSNLRSYAQYQESATVDAILSQTAAATAQQVKDGATAVASTILDFIPWWGYALLAGALVAVVLVLRAQAKGATAAAAAVAG